MASKAYLEPIEIAVIEEHNQRLLDGVERALTKFLGVPAAKRDDAVVSAIIYYENARSVLRWSTGVARQRLSRGVLNGPISGDKIMGLPEPGGIVGPESTSGPG